MQLQILGRTQYIINIQENILPMRVFRSHFIVQYIYNSITKKQQSSNTTRFLLSSASNFFLPFFLHSLLIFPMCILMFSIKFKTLFCILCCIFFLIIKVDCKYWTLYVFKGKIKTSFHSSIDNIFKHLIENYLPIINYILIFDTKMDDHVKQIHFSRKKLLRNKYKDYVYIPKLVNRSWN